ncbi:hypothetical protein COSHB9_11190 [Companilactobacillus alimentarius]|uniref:Uncharacterized protein n=1 Tax=Companilactobacillus alimentarius DSM 20249 TaxID=1423720 RepID=A0A2K9HQV7_9LACO|nr:hypothetical protein [Companilactobacillus alimentarius]AUI72082.1 hypothetical protein LA20249_07775 [Companilactobacillus alimentarius DSM 20249]MDT6952618.1 hypothetical protein [Companilactobacillus alimentarius]GEO44856.1 hypothetical protein LAL01_10880 [Companilactobacillus alimentarius]
MTYVITLFMVLAVLFIIAYEMVNEVYKHGHQIWSMCVGLLSFILLIIGTITIHNQIALIFVQVIFMFGTIVFFMAFTRNYKLYLAGKGKGWIADRTRKIQELNKKHNH